MDISHFLSQFIFATNLKSQLLYSLFFIISAGFLLFYKPKKTPLPLSWQNLFAILFLLSFNFSNFFAQTPYGFKEFLTFNLGIFTFFLIQKLNPTPTQQKKLSTYTFYLTTFTLISLLFFIPSYLNSPLDRFAGSFLGDQTYSNYPNVLAAFIIILLPITAYFYSKFSFQTQRFQKILSLLAILAGFLSLLLTGSRTNLLALAISLILTLSLAGILHRSTSFRQSIKTVLFIAFSTSLIFFTTNLINSAKLYNLNFSNRLFSSTDISATQSVNERFEFFKNSLHIAKSHPLTGTGSGSFQFINPQYQSQSLANSEHPHNLFLKLLAENGIFTSLLFLAWILSIYLPILHNIFTKNSHYHPLFWPLFTSSTAALLASLTDYNLGFPIISFLAFLIFSLLHLQTSPRPQPLLNLTLSNQILKKFYIIFTIILTTQATLLLVLNFAPDFFTSRNINSLKPFATNQFLSSTQSYPNYSSALLTQLKTTANLSPETQLQLLDNYLKLDPLNTLEPYYLKLTIQDQPTQEEIQQITELLATYTQLLSVNAHHTITTENPLFAYLIYETLLQKLNNSSAGSKHLTPQFIQFKKILFQELVKFDTRYQTDLIFQFFDNLQQISSLKTSQTNL